MSIIRTLCLCVLVPFCANAQTLWEVGGSAGITAYSGDLNPNNMVDFQSASPAFHLFLQRNLIPELGLRLQLNGGMVAGDETSFSTPDWRATRGFSFQTKYAEPAFLLQVDPFARRRTRNMEFHKLISPYAFIGPGLLLFKPETNFNNTGEANAVTARERIVADQEATGFSPQWTLIYGAGLHVDLNRKWMLGLEVNLRNTQSDYLDGVSISGTPDNTDWFAYTGITLTRRIYQADTDRDFIPNKHDHCPLVAGPRKMKGCPDADGDRITDAEDACPNLKGVASAKGCPDKDGDSVQDSLDHCLDLAGSPQTQGCPDRDKDGVADLDDPCPDNAGPVALKGCPDVDHDGIADIYDQCPEQGGQVGPNGCPDTDGDGMEDTADKCPDVKGLAAFGGCPDTDGDGIQDSEDKCPGVKGILAFGGCPDTDGDGIQDSDDKCPNEKGTAAMSGCPDADGDGIQDSEDKCPQVKGSIAMGGCPELSIADKTALEIAVKDVQFETGSDALTQSSLPILDKVAEILKRYPNYKVAIEGHTDSVGSAAKNLDLSQRRTDACLKYLIEKGIEKDQLSAKGYGESKPIASNGSATGRAKNRRVEFKLSH